jgi:hypothetical protein
MDEFFNEDGNKKIEEVEITHDLIEKIVKWDKKNKRLDAYKYRFMLDLLEGRLTLTERNKFIATLNLKTIEKWGFDSQS